MVCNTSQSYNISNMKNSGMKRVCLLLFLSALSWKSIRMDGMQVNGTWDHCGNEKDFFISMTKMTGSEAIKCCKQLNWESNLASLDDVLYMQEHCEEKKDNHTYWIEKCHQNLCSAIIVTHKLDRKLQIATKAVPCSDSFAFICRPISEQSTSPRTTQSCIDGTAIPNRTQTPAITSTTLTTSPTSPTAIPHRTQTPAITSTTLTTSPTSPTAIPHGTQTPAITSTTLTTSPTAIPHGTQTPATTTTTLTTSPMSPTSPAAITANTAVTTDIVHSMVNTEQRECIVNYELTSHQGAEVGCILKDNGGLNTCGSVSGCFMTFDTLNLKNGTYWIGGNADHKTECLMYDGNTGAILMSQCDEKHYSICSCQTIRTTGDVLEMPTFKNLIRDMTVNKSETFKASMKLRCQQDKRTSAKMVGSVGVFIMVAVGVFIVLFDFINVIRCCKK